MIIYVIEIHNHDSRWTSILGVFSILEEAVKEANKFVQRESKYYCNILQCRLNSNIDSDFSNSIIKTIKVEK